MPQTEQRDSFDIIAHHGAGNQVITVDRAELDRLRGIEQRADEVANGEGWGCEEQETARHILRGRASSI